MLNRIPFEALVWLTGLLMLISMDPGADHASLCPLNNAGLTICPGCGLGRSISLLFRAQWMASFQAHPLGIFAVIILSFRIANLTKKHIQSYGKSY